MTVQWTASVDRLWAGDVAIDGWLPSLAVMDTRPAVSRGWPGKAAAAPWAEHVATCGTCGATSRRPDAVVPVDDARRAVFKKCAVRDGAVVTLACGAGMESTMLPF